MGGLIEALGERLSFNLLEGLVFLSSVSNKLEYTPWTCYRKLTLCGYFVFH